MIKVELHGRLGNQLFQYAAARLIREKTGQEILISLRTIENEKDKEGGKGWEDSLRYFNVTPYKTYREKLPLMFYKSSVLQIALMLSYYLSYKFFLEKHPYDFAGLKRRQLKWAPILNRFGVWWLKQGYYKYECNYLGNYFLNGGFESPGYFDEIRSILLKEFTLKSSLDDEQKKTQEYLDNCESICISIRKFDLMDDEREKIYKVCDEDYFHKAINIMTERLEQPVFYVCSNDTDWVKEHFDFNSAKVVYENGLDAPQVKLMIMAKCKHFIISNSTFSWWAQYLGTYKEKKVIAPRRWYNLEFDSPLLEDKRWIYI